MEDKAKAIKEVWVLVWDHGELVPPMEEVGHDELLAFGSEHGAYQAAVETMNQYGDDDQFITPVRIFPTYHVGQKCFESPSETPVAVTVCRKSQSPNQGA